MENKSKEAKDNRLLAIAYVENQLETMRNDHKQGKAFLEQKYGSLWDYFILCGQLEDRLAAMKYGRGKNYEFYC